MKRMLGQILLLGLLCGMVHAQTPAINLTLTITDGTVNGNKKLNFGLDPAATDGFDESLGEAELPPFPPTGVFEARFIGSDIGISMGQGTDKDYRTGNSKFNGMHTHELKYQVGSGTSITISWDLPNGVTGLLQDLFEGVVVNKTMDGAGSHTITNLGIDKLKMVITYALTTTVEQKREAVPTEYLLSQNFPNPLRASAFNSITAIKYDLRKPAEVKLEILDFLGKHMRTLVNQFLSAGSYSSNWDGRNEAGQIVPSGVYIYQLKAGNVVQSRKMLFLR